MTTFKEDTIATGELIETNLKKKGVDCDFGKVSAGKDCLYDLGVKLDGVGKGWSDTGLIRWDSSKQSAFKTHNDNIVIGTGGGFIDYGDGIIEKLTAGRHSFNHTYSDTAKIYDIRISNVVEIIDGIDSENTACFKGCLGLISVYLPVLTTLSAGDNKSSSTFYECSNLTSVNLPSLTTITCGGHNETFIYCTSLTSVNLPSLTTINCATSAMFRWCSNLITVDLPLLDINNNYGNSFLCNARSIKKIDLSSITTIKSNPLAWTEGFLTGTTPKVIIFGTTTPPTVSNSKHLSELTNVIIIVPNGCKSAYENATNMPNKNNNTYVEARA